MTTDYLHWLAQVLVFPGLLFTASAGLVTSWIDRKVTARVQMRVGPPFLQPWYDFLKLLIKETIVPAGGAKWLFLSAPLLGLGAVTLASTIIWRSQLAPHQGFVGDVIVLLYLLTMPAVGTVLGAFSSRNPLASLGGSREMKLVMGYELPFVLAVLVPVIRAKSLRLGDILAVEPSALAASGVIALLVSVFCIQAKLTQVPFDLPEAETELTGGAYIEYSGVPLALFKLTKAMMLFTLPVFLVALFGGGMGLQQGWAGLAAGIAKYLGIVIVLTLIRNTAPRVRIDQAVKFFWGPLTVAAAVAVGLALGGW
ncbi:MAG: complex I subunit 1 family protein [candidate division FCPU426 bacterium]